MPISEKFYLGRIYDLPKGKTTAEPLLYDPADLTTHAVVVGMTGSGKTGLCIDLMEEAALLGIPALMIDPKGDLTNVLLHFPDLSPQDFQPWVDSEQARREGKTTQQVAQEVAQRWRDGIQEWGIGAEQVHALSQSVQFTIYTPGSDAGVPINILTSLEAPQIPWQGNRDVLRDRISSTVTALLGLVGLREIDPLRSREHILLSNLVEHAWSRGEDLPLEEMILQIQSPPFSKLGVFEVNTFYPQKERLELAMLLNNILAAPAFQIWSTGALLDMDRLLYTPEGRPRHGIFYISHLSDAERMFFVTLLFSTVETWIRSQPGTPNLRAMLYFDEIYGYLPPVSNPPSKPPLMRLLKQARAFGIGLVLVTQNPVDLDYKALSNAGTWFIGKLQTDQDKQRLLDGLQGAMPGEWNRSEFDRLISSLGKRVFLMHNVHEKRPVLFQTRWAMNYLAGPLTSIQIPILNRMAGAALSAAEIGRAVAVGREAAEPQAALAAEPLQTSPTASRAKGVAGADALGSTTRPPLPSGVKEYFLPINLSFTQALQSTGRPFPQEAYQRGLIYRPHLLGQANVRFLQRRYNLDHQERRAVLVAKPEQRGLIPWDEFVIAPIELRRLEPTAAAQARFAPLEAPLSDAKTISAMQKDFLDWVYRTSQITIRAHPRLKLYAGPGVSHAEFQARCAEAARKGREDEAKKLADSFDKKIDALKVKLGREERELEEDRTELSQRRMEEIGTHAENVLSLFGRRSSRRLTTSLSKRRMTEQAKAEVEESIAALQEYKRQIEALEREKAATLEEVNRRWGEVVEDITEIPITPYQKDIALELFGVAWMPYYLVEAEGQTIEVSGFAP